MPFRITELEKIHDQKARTQRKILKEQMSALQKEIVILYIRGNISHAKLSPKLGPEATKLQATINGNKTKSEKQLNFDFPCPCRSFPNAKSSCKTLH